MYIYGSAEIDKQGRINLSGFFPEGEDSKKIGLAIDVDLNMIIVESERNLDENTARMVVKLDAKNRICIPKWIISEFEKAQIKQLLFIYHDKNRYLSPKTGSIL